MSRLLRAAAIERWSSSTASSRSRFTDSGTASGISAAGVPGWGEKAKAPRWSNSTSSMNRSSISKSSSVSPGNPTSTVVRSVRSGTSERSQAIFSRRRSGRSGRRIRSRTRALACWIGMSMYDSRRSSRAISSTSGGLSPAE